MAAAVGQTLVMSLLFYGYLAVADELTPELIATIREVSDPVLSPNSRRVAYTVDSPNYRSSSDKDIWVVETSGDSIPESLVQNPGPDVSPAWSPDGEQIAFLSRGPEQESGNTLYVADRSGENQNRLTPKSLRIRKFEWSDSGDRIAFIANGLWIVEVESGRLTRTGGTGTHVLDLAWSPDGKRIAVNDDNELAIIDTQSGAKLATLTDGVSKPWSRRRIFDWSPDGKNILYAELADENVSPAGIGFWMSVIPAEGGEPRPILKNHRGTITQALWSADSRHLLAQSFEGTTSKIIRINLESGAIEVLVDNIFEEKSFSVDAGERGIAWLSSTYVSPVDVWYSDLEGTRERLTSINEAVAAVATGEVRQIRWTNSAGQPLYGVLVLPIGYQQGTKYPTVVQLHGGPHFAWWEGWLGTWHDWAQLLATNGYAVFLPNPRGSTGQGLQFSLANVNDLAVGPFEDIMRGVDHLIDIGIADPDRLGVGGWSYGGYLTAWTITQTDRFKAAVVGAGISRMTKRSHMLLKEYYENIDVRKRYDHLARVSPENYLENVVTPTLVIHGKEDPKINYHQAIELHDGLAELGVDTKIILYEEEGHGISSVSNRTDMLKNIVSWYDRYLKDVPRTVSERGGPREPVRNAGGSK